MSNAPSRAAVLLALLGACAADPAAQRVSDDDATLAVAATDTDDTDVDLPAWGRGPRAVSGEAWFFDMPTFGDVEAEHDVTGAEVYVVEAPEIRATVDPSDAYAFRLEGIPDGVDVTLALVHPDHYPSLTATLRVDGADLEGVSFQSVSWAIAEGLAGIVGADVADPTTCHMVTTVSAPGAVDVWAVGQPGATVTVTPSVPEDQGPVYFNPSVVPDRRLTATTTDGGVIVAGATPGTYTWTGQQDGVVFDVLTMPCVAGWLTNASPPWGMNAHLPDAP